MTAQAVRRLDLASAQPHRINALPGLGMARFVKAVRPPGLQELAAQMAVAPLKKSPGKDPTLTDRLSNRKPVRAATLMKLPKRPGHRGCRLRQSNRNANQHFDRHHVRRRAVPQPIAPHFAVLLRTDPVAVVPARSVRNQIDQDQTDPDQTALVLIAPPPTGPVAHVQPAVRAARALGSLAQAVHRVRREIVRGPSPRALASLAPEARAPATSVLERRRLENPHGSPRLADPAGPLPQAARNRPSVPDPAGSQSPARASKAKPAAPASRPVADPVGPDLVDPDPAGRDPVERSEARHPVQTR